MKNDYQMTIVTDMAEFHYVTAIRCQSFNQEPILEEVDGNDFCGTHFLGRDGTGAPVAAMRWRYLGYGVSIWERLSIPDYASDPRLLYLLAKTANEYSQFKGIKRALGAVHNKRLLKFWRRHGFEETGSTRTYGGRQYLEIAKVFPNFKPPSIEYDGNEAERFSAWQAQFDNFQYPSCVQPLHSWTPRHRAGSANALLAPIENL